MHLYSLYIALYQQVQPENSKQCRHLSNEIETDNTKSACVFSLLCLCFIQAQIRL